MFRTILPFIIILFFSCGVSFATPHIIVSTKTEHIPEITLKQFIKRALLHSSQMKKARIQIARYEAMVSHGNMLYAPTLSVSFKGAPSPKYECVMPASWINPSDFNGLSEKEFKEKYCVGTNRDDSLTLNLDGYALRFQINAVQPLYTFGKIAYAKAMARAALSGGKANLIKEKNQLMLLARKTFYARVAAIKTIKLVNEASKLMAVAKNKAEKYEEESKISPSQLLRLKLGENLIKTKSLEASRINIISLSAFRILSGSKSDVKIPKKDKKLMIMPKSVEDLYKIAIKNRPEVKMLESARALSVARLGLAKASFMPSIGLFARYSLRISNSDDPKNVYANDGLHGNSLVFGLGIEMKLNPSKMITAVRVARLEKRRRDADIAASKDLLKMQITKAREDVVYNIKKIKLIKKGIKLSRAWIMAMKDLEESGSLKPKEMVDSMVSYLKYKVSFIETMYALQVAKANMDYNLGLIKVSE